MTETVIKKELFAVKPTYEHLLFKMIDDLLASNKKVILLTIPSDQKYIFSGQKLNTNSQFPHDVFRNQKIALKNYVPHLSGYDVFKNVKLQVLKTYWPSYDGHWLQAGFDFFAEKIMPQIKEIIEAPGGKTNC